MKLWEAFLFPVGRRQTLRRNLKLCQAPPDSAGRQGHRRLPHRAAAGLRAPASELVRAGGGNMRILLRNDPSAVILAQTFLTSFEPVREVKDEE